MKNRNKNVLALSFIATCWFASLPIHAADLVLNDTVRENFGLTTAVLAKTQVARTWQAAAQVLDASPLVTSMAELHTASSAAAASSAELKRAEALNQANANVALKTVEAARAQAVSDQSRAQSLRAQLLSSWGAALLRMSAAEQDRLAESLLNGRTVLLRAELGKINAIGAPASRVRLKFGGSDVVFDAKLVGPMPQRADQGVGTSYLLTVESATLQPGQVLTAELQQSDAAWAGVKVPRGAIVRWQGQDWVYLDKGQGHYERRALKAAQWLDDGALIEQGLNAGDRVVSTGAGLLLGAEFSPPQEAKEEGE